MTVEQEILRVYDSNLKDVLSINQISKKTGKAYPYINKKVKILIDKGILKKTSVGHSHLCSVNLGNKQTIMFLSLNEIAKHKNLPEEIINAIRIIEENRQSNQVHCVAYDPATEKLLITTDETSLKEKLGEGPWEFITINEMKDRLLNDKDFFTDRIVIEGYEQFFSLMTSNEIDRRYHPLL